GGSITLDAGLLTISGPHLVLDASGVNGGNGGFVSVTTRSAIADLVVGLNPGQIEIRATGGDSGSETGNGGTVILSAGRALTVNMNAIAAAPLGDNGDGSTLKFAAGTAAPASLLVSGDVDAAGVGIGNGGLVDFRASRRLFVDGDIDASAGTELGD